MREEYWILVEAFLDGFEKTGIGDLVLGIPDQGSDHLGYPLVYDLWSSEFGSSNDSLHVLLWI